jgi:hypothetical protein
MKAPTTTLGPERAKDYLMLKTPKKKRAFNHYQLHKTPTGIKGFDEITEGGLPKNRTTLFSGSTREARAPLLRQLFRGVWRSEDAGSTWLPIGTPQDYFGSAVKRMLFVTTKRRANTFFMIVHRKVRIQRVVNRAATTCGSRRLRSILAQ